MSNRGRGRSGRGRGRSSRGRGGRVKDASVTNQEIKEQQIKQPRVIEPLVDIVVPFTRLTPKDLRDIKDSLLNIVAAALIQQPRASVNDPTMRKITVMVKKIAFYDPAFVLKLAIYVRLDLNIRSTANYLLSVAANIKECQPYFKKYFGATIRLPSDWIDVAATYQQLPDKSLKGKSLPTCLRKSMVSKFPEFDAYQLGKYNKERSIKRKLKKMKEEKAKNPGTKIPELKPMLTLKQLIRQLHISQPSLNVMCLLGKKYPLTESLFHELNLPGRFQEEKAGRRMKLPTPETWETLLSEKGNKSSTWEELIEHKKLPFMAMLRNLRNLIYTGVHPRYHKWAQNKLSNAVTIAQSKQFPFRFFSAYEVIPRDMEHFKQLIAGQDDKKKKAKAADSATAEAPPIRRKKKKLIVPTHMPSQKIFDEYRTALDQAVKHATVHNVQPIRGSTVVFCNVSRETRENAPGAKGMGSSVRNIQEVGYLLGLMCKYVCEDCDFIVYSSPSESHPDTNYLSVNLIEGTILDNMAVVAQQAKELGPEGLFPYDYLENMIRDKRRVDNFLVLSHQVLNPGEGQNELANLLNKYRSEVNPDMLFVSVDLSGSGRSTIGSDDKHPLDIMITGFSDQILRFIAERGDQNQLQYVEHIDEAKNLNKKEEIQEAYEVSPWWRWLDTLGHEDDVVRYPNIVLGPPWRSVRVFISSTFLDMHGERDILTRIVFPELKERAKKRKINIFEVDLRWGVTEEESQQGKSIDLCLSEVERCRPFFIGILGNRYGWAPEEYEVPDHPRYDWLKDYPKGRSITELEMQLAALNNPLNASGAFFYFRDNQFLDEVPDHQKRFFEDNSEEARFKMEDLKDRIRESGLPIYENYPCSFGGISEGKPATTNLTMFAERVFFDLWSAIDQQFPQEPPPSDYVEYERSYHQSFVQTLTTNFSGRKEMTEQMQKHIDSIRSQLMIITGKAGEGKSALVANFAKQLAEKDDKLFVLAHFIGASPGSTDIRKTLYRLCSELQRVFELDIEVPSEYKELCNIFPKMIEEATFKGKVVIIIDAVNQLDDKINRSHTMDWLPSKLSCKFIISTTEGKCYDSLKYRYGNSFVELKMTILNPRERTDLVRDTLWQYHKKLDERPMNNQMRVLLRKAEAGIPLYLTVACEELRVFGVYERIADRIKSMGDKIPKLFEEVLQRLEVDHTKPLVQDACSLIMVSRNGLLESELRVLLNTDDYQWAGFLRSLSAFLKPVGDEGEITFFHQQFSAAVTKRYLPNPRIIQRYHSRLSDFFYDRADRPRDGTWKGGNDVRAIRELPYHLICSEKYDDVVFVLTDLAYVELKISMGQTFDLIEDYNAATVDSLGSNSDYNGKTFIREFKNFVKANANILQHNPSLTFQQASNQPAHTEPAKRAMIRWRDNIESRSWVKWLNKPVESDSCKQTYSGYQESLTACAYSTNGKMIALASRDCLIRLYNAETGTELFALSGHSNWIVDLKFSPDGSHLASASWDETLKVWEADTGHLLYTFKGHSRRINSCAYSHDSSLLATASWDNTIKIWNIKSGDKDPYKTIITGNCPVNTCAFSPDDKKIIAGTWDGKLKEFNIETGQLVATLTGHQKSVQAVAYEPSGNHLISGGFDNTLILWDAIAGKVISNLAKYSKPVTSVAYTSDGTHVLSACADATTRVWQANLGRQKRVIKVTEGYMNCCSSHPNVDDILAAGTSDCYVVIWNLVDGVEVVRYEGHTRPVTAIEYSSDGSMIASGSEDGIIIIWEAHSGNKLHILKAHTASVTGFSWSPVDGRLASSADDYTIHIWNTKTGTDVIPPLKGHTNVVKSVSFDPKGKLIASASRDNTLRIWDSRNGNCLHTLRGHLDWLNCCHFSPSGNRIVTCSWDFSLMLWNTRKGEAIGSMKGHQSCVSYCRFSPDGKNIVSASFDGTLKIWDAESATEITTLSGHSARVNGFCFSRDGRYIVSVSDDATIKIWDPLAASEIGTLIGHAGPIRSARFSPVNKQIITASDDKTLKMWDLSLAQEESDTFGFSSLSLLDDKKEENVSEKVSGHQSYVNNVCISNDGSKLVTASDDGSFALWDLNTMNKIKHVSRHEPYRLRAFKSARFSHNGQLIVTASDDGQVILWDSRTREEVRTITQHKGPATSCIFGSNDYTVVSGGWDNLVHMTDTRGTQPPQKLSGHEDWVLSVDISNDCRYVVSSGWDSNIRLWSNGSEKSVLLGHSKTVTSVAFSPDARYIASSSYDSCVKLWNTSSGKLEKTLAGHLGHVNSVCFGPKSENILLSAGSDRTVKIWDVNGRLKNEFICQGPATSVAIQSNLVMVYGDVIGNIHIAKLIHM